MPARICVPQARHTPQPRKRGGSEGHTLGTRGAVSRPLRGRAGPEAPLGSGMGQWGAAESAPGWGGFAQDRLGDVRHTSEADTRPLAPRDSAEDTDPEGSEPQSTSHPATRGPRGLPEGIRVGAPGKPPCPGEPAPALPSGRLCHSPSSSRLEVAAPDRRPRQGCALPTLTPPRSPRPGEKHHLHWGRGVCGRITPETKAHPTPSHPLQRGPAERRSPASHVKVKVTHSTLQPHGPYSPWDSPGQSTGVGSRFLPQGIVPAEESRKDPAVCPAHQGPLRPHVDPRTPCSRGCTPQARLGGQVLQGTGHYGFIYRFMGGETTQKPDAPCTPQLGPGGGGGSKSSEPLSSQSPEMPSLWVPRVHTTNAASGPDGGCAHM